MKWFFFAACFVLFSALVFHGVSHIYFQQDEWLGFGKVIYAQHYGFWTLIRQAGSHFTPLTTLFMALFYSLFSLQYTWYALYSVLLHGINGFLVFFLADTMIKNKKNALLSAITFIALAASAQAVSWYAASLSFLPSAFFALVSLILFERSLETNQRTLLSFAVVGVLVGAGFRENAIFLLAYYPVRSALLKHPMIKTIFWSSVFSGCVYVFVRFIPTFFAHQLVMSAAPGRFSTTGILRQAISFIVFYLPQLIVPESLGRPLIHWISGPWAIFIESEFLVSLLYLCLFMASALLLMLFIKIWARMSSERVFLYSCFVFLVLSVLPFSLLPPPLIMESRHFYLSSIGFSLLVSYMFFLLLKRLPMVGKFVIIFAYTVFVGTNVFLIYQSNQSVGIVSKTRRSVIDQITILYPTFPPKVIFYAQGDVLPFQTGIGQMFMVLYHSKQNYLAHLYSNFLGDMGSQGYTEIDGVGFGFYTDFTLLQFTYCQNHLRPEHIFSFFWNDASQIVTDDSRDIRSMLTCPTKEAP